MLPHPFFMPCKDGNIYFYKKLQMLKVGITGGIGSGKTTAAQIFALLGVPVYDADAAAKKLMHAHAGLKAGIIQAFGEDAYVAGTLNRTYLSNIVFKDAEKLTLLNSLVHPVTLADADAWMQQQKTPYALKEAALIFETDAWKHLDLVIGVSSPLEIRIRRTMLRDHIDEAAVMSRINKQMPQAEKMQRCRFVLLNDEQHMLIPQVLQLHEQLTELAGGSES